MTALNRITVSLICVALALPACKEDATEQSNSPSASSGPRRPGSSGSHAAGSREPDGEARAGSGGSGAATSDPSKPDQDGQDGEDGQELAPERGATEFVSADPGQAQGPGFRGALTPGASAAAGSGAAPPTASDGTAEGTPGAAPRSVERGDIYKVLADGRILNLNSYRGLQVIDVRDVNAPRIEGRLAVTGTPVEMYVVGERAIVLLNGWQGYYGSRDDVAIESVQGGLVLNVDLRDRAKPVVLGQAIVDGSISTSRLTQGGGKVALYVAASVNKNEPPYTSSTLIESFDVSGNEVASKSELDLGGYVQDVQATTDLLLVSSIDYQMSPQRSTVSLIDISSPDGVMVKGGSITARGTVANKFNMDAYKGVLRVVSGSSWSGTQENHLETFSLADLARPRPLASCAFGATEMLYATIFIENKGFFVTYFRQDPFHAFSIDDQGRCEEHNQFIVSGWNDFLRPTLAGTRLIGVGRNDENRRSTVSVSLYDAVNIDNTQPLLARSDLALDQSYSEAQWDDRAFSVIEDAVSVQAANLTTETGLVLLPFEGYDATSQTYVAQVQVLTFSDRTLTRRGVMDHGSAVRRSFLASANTAANLSEQELRLFDLANPNTPQARGKVEVAPNYRQVLVYGDFVARVHDSSFYWRWNGGNVSPPAAQVEILPRSADLDSGPVVASFAVPSTATLTQVGNLLVSSLTQLDASSGTAANPNTSYTTNIDVYDLSDPTKPQKRGSLETDRITPSYSFGRYPGGPSGIAIDDCFDCRRPGHSATSQYVTGPAIVYVSTKQQQRSLGTVHSCYEYPVGSTCSSGLSGRGCEEYYSGQITCTTRKGEPEQCSGEFFACNSSNGECKPVPDGTKIETQKSCSDYEEFRYWQSYGFDPLDLRDPGQPVLAPPVVMKEDEEGTSLLASGTGLYFNYQQPQVVSNDPRAYVKRYFRLIDFADPSKPSVGPGINIPGDVIANEGSTVFTRDFVWEDTNSRTMVARLEVQGDRAELKASRVFAQRQVSAVKPDGAGHVLVSSDPSYYGLPVATPPPSAGASPVTPAEPPKHLLSILDAQSLEVSGEAEVDQWATFTDAKAGRALFSVSGGLLVFNVEDAAKPVAQAYFPTITFPSDLYFDGKEALFAAGPYGIYRFDTDVFNLLTK